MSNQQIRSDIMTILDDNSKDIPEGIYLQLCNQLMKFKFEDQKVDEESNEEIDRIARQVRGGEEILLTPDSARRINARLAETRSNSRLEAVAPVVRAPRAPRQSRYVTNPETGRQVLRTGRIGRRLARQE